jgi:hypothetical protein
MTDGYLYCLSNPSIPNLLKIGMTTRTPEERAKELFTTGVATPFNIEFSRKVSNPGQKEKDIHKILENYRIPSREFFDISVNEAIRVIDTYLSENLPIFLSVDDVLRSEDVSKLDKARMIACLRKNKEYDEFKPFFDSQLGENSRKFIENTTIIWHNDKTLIYKVNSDNSIEYIKSIKTSDYHSIGISGDKKPV